eukprot:TRINITY_DN10041_c1_g1_i1.p1 TRINITY_DN10041_c1_g1~~TRINITY_DN10041_c1_g1_i1.p1  ORF type:complete len:569 (-),score=95.43 TRINITY_DN10041_c1_g1_i1:129-1811(-)
MSTFVVVKNSLPSNGVLSEFVLTATPQLVRQPSLIEGLEHGSLFSASMAAASVVAVVGISRHHRRSSWTSKVQRRRGGFFELFGSAKDGSNATDSNGNGAETPTSWSLSPPTWKDLEAKLKELQSPEEVEAEEAVRNGKGLLSARAKGGSEIRLFETSEASEVRVTFYRDHAAWCPYCQKVQLALEGMRIPYRIKKVNMNCYGEKPMDFLMKNPMGLLPVAEIDGTLITESNEILRALEAQFPDRILVPAGRGQEVDQLLRLERQIFSSWFSWLRSPFGDKDNRANFLQDLKQVELRLQSTSKDGPFFLGESFSIVECHFASFLERMAASLAYFKGFRMRGNPEYKALEAWFQAMEELDSYSALAGDFYTHAHDLPPQVGGCAENGQNIALREEIDGKTSWRLPLTPPDEGIRPLFASKITPDQDPSACREAARRILANRDKIIPFCLRGRGRGGFPPVGAGPLSDPNAAPSDDENLKLAVDEALRGVVSHLLAGDGSAVAEKSKGVLGPTAWKQRQDVSACLSYLQNRVSVPRDMTYPAARQLRAHLGSYIEAAEKVVI